MCEPYVVNDSNLSCAWARALVHTYDTAPRACAPLVVSVSGFRENVALEDPSLRMEMDAELLKNRKGTSRATSSTIFPYEHWRRRRPSADDLYCFYLEKLLPRLKKRCRLNQYGTYFERMINFTGVRRGEIRTTNQLKFVIEDWRRARLAGTGRRRTALQVACFDPAKDHTGQASRWFPCLQQVSFGYDEGGQLSVFGYYPVEYVFDRGYGNYLGLCHLGHFVADQVGLQLGMLVVFVARPQIGKVTKEVLKEFVGRMRNRLAAATTIRS